MSWKLWSMFYQENGDGYVLMGLIVIFKEIFGHYGVCLCTPALQVDEAFIYSPMVSTQPCPAYLQKHNHMYIMLHIYKTLFPLTAHHYDLLIRKGMLTCVIEELSEKCVIIMI